jgi:hypothetical protein
VGRGARASNTSKKWLLTHHSVRLVSHEVQRPGLRVAMYKPSHSPTAKAAKLSRKVVANSNSASGT